MKSWARNLPRAALVLAGAFALIFVVKLVEKLLSAAVGDWAGVAFVVAALVAATAWVMTE